MTFCFTEFPDRDSLASLVVKLTSFYRSGHSGGQPQQRHDIVPIGKVWESIILTPQDIGAIVRQARKSSGLRQDELAGAAGVGLRFIVDLEAGKPTAQIGKALQVLATLGCSLTITSPAPINEPQSP